MTRTYDRIVVDNPEYANFLPRPDDRDIDIFVTNHHFTLPESYREFCQQFGAGELGGHIRIASPTSDANDYELGQFNSDWHGAPGENLLEGYGPPDVVDRLFFFASTIGGEGYAWKLDEVTNLAHHEYAIYYVPRYNTLIKKAVSFAEFVENECLATIVEPDGTQWTPEPIYRRFGS